MARPEFPFDGRVLLAPLSGVSDSPFRTICKGFGAEGVYSEMISCEGLTRKNPKSAELARFAEEERPIGIQLFGNSPGRMAEAARMIEDKGPDLIDINACCPARRIAAGGSGSALLVNLNLLSEIVTAVVGSTSLPVTVKIRAGWDEESISAVPAARVAEDAGAVAVCVHGRTAKQGFHGRSDWGRIAEVKRAVKIPVILTGDIMRPEDVAEGMTATGCDAVMVARGSFGRPWIFEQIRECRQTGTYAEFPYERMAEVALRHLDLMTDAYGEKMGVLRFRKHLLWYTKGLYGVVALREQMSHVHSKSEVATLLDRVVSGVERRRQARGEERA